MKTNHHSYGMNNHAAHIINETNNDQSEEKENQRQDDDDDVEKNVKDDGSKVQEVTLTDVPQQRNAAAEYFETTTTCLTLIKENDELKKEIQKMKMKLRYMIKKTSTVGKIKKQQKKRRPPQKKTSSSLLAPIQIDDGLLLTEMNPLLKEKSIGMNNSYSSTTLPTDNNHDDDCCCECASSSSSNDDDDSSVFDTISFNQVLIDRASWLIGLLVFQSLSSFILENNDDMLANHLDIVHFLTMLVGAGGNAGNQASVNVIRGLAVGTLNHRSMKNFIVSELKMAFCLGGVLALSGLLRAAMFRVPLPETVAITASLWMIVVMSIILGAVLPLSMKYVGIDPAHSSTTIQVVMDILGVTITCRMSQLILDTTMGQNFISILTKLRG